MNPSTSSILRPKSPRPDVVMDEDDDDDDRLEAAVGPPPPQVVSLRQGPPRQRHHTGGGGAVDGGGCGDVTCPELRLLGGTFTEEDYNLSSSSTVLMFDDEPRPAEFLPPVLDGGSGGVLDERLERLRQNLAFFFMDPVQKFMARRQIPFKLFLQLIKIVIISMQLFIFGDYRYAHTKYYADNQIAFEHLFLKGWDAVREIHAYPPTTGAYAIYQKTTFYDYFDFIAATYGQLENITVNPVFRNSSLKFCVERFADGHVFSNLSWDIDFEHMSAKERCLVIPDGDLADMRSKDYLLRKNFEVPWDTMTRMHINFTVNTLTYTTLGPILGPECFSFRTKILFDNSDYDGQIPVSLDVEPHRKRCPSPKHFSGDTSFAVKGLNYAVILVCVLSLVLCVRALVRAQILRAEAHRVFREKLGWELTWGEKLEFLNFWYIVIIVNDVFIIIGSIIKELIESKNVYGDLWDFCSLFLGIGNLLVWLGMLRYLGFFKTYNVLILTMKGALPNVLRFLFCASLIYFGFVFCGWLILGPYNFKFKTIFTTSECLFSLINGDDMFATFSSVPSDSMMIWIFSKVYLYFFISLFIYVVLSLFIAIIMDTYDIIKEYYKKGFPKERMHEFYKSAGYTPASGIFMQNQQQQRWSRSPGFMARLWRCCRPEASASAETSAAAAAVQEDSNGYASTDQTALIT